MEWTNEILVSVFISFPEAMLVLLMGFALCGIKVAFNKILFISILQGIVSFIVNVLDILVGLDSIVLLVIMWWLVMIVLRVKIYQGAMVVLAGFFVQAVLQIGFYHILSCFIYDVKIIRTKDFMLAILSVYPVFAFSIVLLKIILKKKITIV